MNQDQVQSAREMAEAELQEENTEDAVSRIKDLLQLIRNSKKVTANLERELEELELELAHNDVS